MKKRSVLQDIEIAVDQLDPQDQLRLVEKLAQKLRRADFSKKELDWAELYGLGKGLWGREDAQDYVNRYREDRS